VSVTIVRETPEPTGRPCPDCWNGFNSTSSVSSPCEDRICSRVQTIMALDIAALDPDQLFDFLSEDDDVPGR
jgi:hypothetical protein